MRSTFPVTTADTLSLARVGITPLDSTRSRGEQTRSVLERMEAALAAAGMTFRDVVRTWFHLDDILAWYGEFNDVRTAFFRERGVFDGLVPASTGVGRANPAGAAVLGGFLAVRPLSDRARVLAVASPLQCSALNYASAFSRAVEVAVPGRRHLFISGTAAIAPEGASEFPGDVDAQIRRTMDVVEAILASRGLSFTDTVRAVAYFADRRDFGRLDAYARSHALDVSRFELVEATICRKELLFELELEAARLGETRVADSRRILPIGV